MFYPPMFWVCTHFLVASMPTLMPSQFLCSIQSHRCSCLLGVLPMQAVGSSNSVCPKQSVVTAGDLLHFPPCSGPQVRDGLEFSSSPLFPILTPSSDAGADSRACGSWWCTFLPSSKFSGTLGVWHRHYGSFDTMEIGDCYKSAHSFFFFFF